MNQNPKRRKPKARFRIKLGKSRPRPKNQTNPNSNFQHPHLPQQQIPPLNTVTPVKRKRKRKKIFKKFSELTPKEKEIYLNRKQNQLLKQERKLQKSIQKSKAKSKPKPKTKSKAKLKFKGRKQKNKDPFAIDYRSPPPMGDRKLRKNKKRHKKNYTLYYILLTIFMCITLYGLSITIWFEIEEIEVVGDTDISHEDIINISGIQIYENLVKLSEKNVSEKVRDEYITIETVELNKKFPNKVEIEVTMAQPKALLYYDRLYYTLSESDRIISFGTRNYYERESLISFIGADLEEMDLGDYLADVDLDFLEDVDRLLTAIEENEFTKITYVDVSNISDIRFYVDDLYEIKAGGFTEISYKLHCAKWIINLQDVEYEQKGIIDVSVDNGKYYLRPSLDVNPNL